MKKTRQIIQTLQRFSAMARQRITAPLVFLAPQNKLCAVTRLLNRYALPVALTLFCLVAVAAYWPALRGEFVWDDLLLVKQNQLAAGEFNLRTIWFHADFPLSTIAFWL